MSVSTCVRVCVWGVGGGGDVCGVRVFLKLHTSKSTSQDTQDKELVKTKTAKRTHVIIPVQSTSSQNFVPLMMGKIQHKWLTNFQTHVC